MRLHADIRQSTLTADKMTIFVKTKCHDIIVVSLHRFFSTNIGKLLKLMKYDVVVTSLFSPRF